MVAVAPQSCGPWERAPTPEYPQGGREAFPASGVGVAGHNPFVLVNYSSTICLNPTFLISGGSGLGEVLADLGRSREEM
jgi:hypothetical protein